VFVSGDANANITACSYIQTPTGFFAISGFTSDQIVTITVPSTYVNETTVAFSKHKKLFQITTGDIGNTLITLQNIISTQPAFPIASGDKLSTIYFGTTTNTSDTTISYTHNGTARYSHLDSPIVLRHNDLAGLGISGASEPYGHIPNGALPNGTTATTQLFGDNSTKVATDAFVQAAISGGIVADVFQSNNLYVSQFGSDKAEIYYPGGTTGTGFINVAADFPTPGGVINGDCYTVPNGVTVIDNDVTKTNTGQTFVGPMQIAWDSSNTRWLERNGLTIDNCVSSICTAVYLASFISNPPIYVLDNATYTFGDNQTLFSPLIAPAAKIVCLGYAVNFSPSVLFDTLEINYIATHGGFLCPGFTNNYIITGKYAYFNGTPASVGIFVNNGSGKLILNIGEINGLSSSNQTLSAQGVPIYANIGKFTGKASVTTTGSSGSITFNTLNISDVTVNDTLGPIYFPAMKRINSSGTYGYPYMKPMIANDAIVTDTKFIGASNYSALTVCGYFNDGTYSYQSYSTPGYSIWTSGDGVVRIKMQLSAANAAMEFLDATSPQNIIGSMSTILTSDWICNVPYQLNGGIKNTYATTAINVADASNPEFNTTNKTMTGSLNEVLSGSNNSELLIRQAIGQIYNGETQLYFDSSVVVAAGSENNNPIYTFTTAPDGSTESNLSRSISSGSSPTLMAGFQYVNSNMNYYGLSAGVTIGKIWAYLSALNAGTTTELLQNVMSISSYGTATVTITGTGSSRNVTATTNSFVAGDANADRTIASFLKTPKGLYQIIGYVSPTQVVITVPAGYVSEAGVIYNKWFKLYQMTSGDIQYTTPAKEITFFSNPQGEYSPATSIDWQTNNQVGILLFGSTTSATSVTVNLTFNGSSNYSHIDLPGLIPIKSHGFSIETNATLGARRTRTISGTGSFSFNFLIPEECERILSAYLVCYPSAGAAGSARDIDLTVEYNNNLGESITQYSASDLSSTYNLTGYANNRYELHFESLLSSAKGGAEGGVKVDQNSVGGNMDYTEVVIEYVSR